MSVNATINLGLTARETLSVVDAQVPTIIHNLFNVNLTLNAASTPPATQVSSQTLTNTQTIDLTALPTTGGVVNATALKVRAILITNPATNHGALVVGGGANATLILGAVSVSIPLGGTLVLYAADGLAVVDATHKLLLCTPNNALDSYNVELIVG